MAKIMKAEQGVWLMTADVSSSSFPCLVSLIQDAARFGKRRCCGSHSLYGGKQASKSGFC